MLRFALSLALALGAAQAQPFETGLPPTRVFSADDFGSHPQVWSAARGAGGLVYFGNREGVLRWDGAAWTLIPHGVRTAVRALAVDEAGTVWVAADGAVGRVTADAHGRPRYAALTDALPPGFSVGTARDVHVLPDGVHFLSDHGAVRWDGERFHLTSERSLDRARVVDRTLYAADADGRVWAWRGGAWRALPGAEGPAGPFVQAHPDGGLVLIGAGLFRYRDGQVAPIEGPASDWLREVVLVDVAPLPGGRFALAADGGGVLVADVRGRIVQHLHEGHGLPDDAVYSLTPEADGGVWITHETGIVWTGLGAPVSVFDARNGLPGTLDALARFRGRLYATSNRGVFRLRPGDGTRPARFEPLALPSAIADFRGLLALGDSSLLVATQQGVWELGGPRPARVPGTADDYAFYLLASRRHPGVVYAALRGGVRPLQRTASGWRALDRIGLDGDEIRWLEEDADGRLWLGTFRARLLRLDLRTLRPDPPAQAWGEADGLVQGGNLPIRPADTLVIASMERVMAFDGARFVPTPLYGEVPMRQGVVRLAAGPGGDLYGASWVQDGPLRLDVGAARRTPDGWRWQSGLLYPHGPLLTWAVLPEAAPAEAVWFGGTGALVRHAAPRAPAPAPFRPVVSRVTAGADSVVWGGHGDPAAPTLGPDLTAFRFQFGAPRPGGGETTYRTRLDGLDADWGLWTEEPRKDYTNLAPGRYAFRVQARDGLGRLSEPAAFAFAIRPPWWGTWWARLAMGLAAVALVAWAARRGPEAAQRLWARLPHKRMVAHYRLDALLGRGGAGEVWAATDVTAARTGADRHVALKLLHPDALEPAPHRRNGARNGVSRGTGHGSGGAQRLRREADLLAGFDHPHIVRVFEGGVWNGTPFLAMQRLDGRTLRRHLQEHGPLPVAQAVRVGAALADALATVHAAGIVHRDVKGDNVMLVPDAGAPGRLRPVLMDFGLARGTRLTTLTQLGTLLGTLGYCAPEQAMGAAEPDARSDVFSLGVVLFEALTGQLPFEGDNEIAMLHAIFSAEPPAPAALRPEVPEALSDLVLACLARDPDARPASAAVVRDALLGLSIAEA